MDQKNVESFNPNEPFDFHMYLTILSDVVSDMNEFNNLYQFTRLCRETTKVFQELGGILKKAFEDIHDKCNIMIKNYKMHQNFHTGIIPFILIEKSMDVAKLNGQNGDFLADTDMKKYKDYESTARTVLRLMWFLDFVFYMMSGLVKDQSQSLSSICSEAYSKALAPNHPTHIVLGVKAGMMMVPNRDRLMEIFFHDKNYPKAQAKSDIEIASVQIDLIRNRLWEFYRKEDLTKLP